MGKTAANWQTEHQKMLQLINCHNEMESWVRGQRVTNWTSTSPEQIEGRCGGRGGGRRMKVVELSVSQNFIKNEIRRDTNPTCQPDKWQL